MNNFIKARPNETTDKQQPYNIAGKTYLLDGSNIIRSYMDNDISICVLLTVASYLIHNKSFVLCIFDANIYYVLDESGKHVEAAFYRELLKKHPILFCEVPGGSSADDFILKRADSCNADIISNDKYDKNNDGFINKYPWLSAKPSRLHKGKAIAGNIVIPSLDIDIPFIDDIEAIKAKRDILFDSTIQENDITPTNKPPLKPHASLNHIILTEKEMAELNDSASFERIRKEIDITESPSEFIYNNKIDIACISFLDEKSRVAERALNKEERTWFKKEGYGVQQVRILKSRNIEHVYCSGKHPNINPKTNEYCLNTKQYCFSDPMVMNANNIKRLFESMKHGVLHNSFLNYRDTLNIYTQLHL